MSDASAVSIPRPAATVLLIRDTPLEVLLVRRSTGADFPDALVFPGGMVDASDGSPEWAPFLGGGDRLDAAERALRVAALREVHEETGLIVARDGTGRPLSVDNKERRSFFDVVRGCDGRLPLDLLVPFGHWITPPTAPRRYDTYFFLCPAPAGQEPRHDGSETVALEWMRPAEALALVEGGDSAILFPTLMNLARLAESGDVATALAAAGRRAIVTVMPAPEPHPEGTLIRIPAEAGYPRTEFLNRRRRSRPA